MTTTYYEVSASWGDYDSNGIKQIYLFIHWVNIELGVLRNSYPSWEWFYMSDFDTSIISMSHKYHDLGVILSMLYLATPTDCNFMWIHNYNLSKWARYEWNHQNQGCKALLLIIYHVISINKQNCYKCQWLN